jgi:hypothetical protein
MLERGDEGERKDVATLQKKLGKRAREKRLKI